MEWDLYNEHWELQGRRRRLLQNLPSKFFLNLERNGFPLWEEPFPITTGNWSGLRECVLFLVLIPPCLSHPASQVWEPEGGAWEVGRGGELPEKVEEP